MEVMAVGDLPRAAELGLRVVNAETYPSWEAIYRDNLERLYRLMFAKVGNRPDAEDLTAEVFLAAVPRLRMTASVGEVRAYLTAIASTVLANHWRRTLGRQITAIDPNALPEELTEPAVAEVARRAAEDAEAVLAALPERYAAILRLRFLQSCTLREAARQMDVTVANAKVLQHRALRQAARIIDSGR
jgi:RNA polymerase sigma-70 factor (ECF subfamily)